MAHMLDNFYVYPGIFGIIHEIVRAVSLTVAYKRWRKFATPAVGIVGELKDVTNNYNVKGNISSYNYIYAFKILHGGQEFDDIYSEKAKAGDAPLASPGQKINILWSASECKYLDVDQTKKAIRWSVKQVGIVAGFIILPIVAILIIDRIIAFCS